MKRRWIIQSGVSWMGRLLALLVLTLPVPLWAATLSFQNGVSPDASYTGTEDTDIHAKAPSLNYNTDARLRADGGGSSRSSLIKWDISAIPPTAIVTGATVTFRVSSTSAQTYNIYEMLRPWVASQATWNVYSTGHSWQIAGASGALDRGSIIMGTITAAASGIQTFSLNASGVALVQQWVNDGTTNRGLIVQNYTNTDGLSLYSSATGTATNRPKLTITYTVTMTGYPVSGRVFLDANRNGVLDLSEVGLSSISVELFSVASGTVIATTTTNSNGTYLLNGIENGSYEIRETPPAGYVPTTPAVIAITGNNAPVPNQHFGNFAGVKIAGVVFNDIGTGGGVPNNGIQEGTEAGIVGVSVKATDTTATITYDQTVTDMNGAYTLWVATSTGMTVIVRETNPASHISTTPDMLSLMVSPGDNLSNNLFGDVPPLILTPHGNQTLPPGGIALYAHAITAGTAGPITLSATTTAGLLWTFYKDTNENGQLESGEPVLTDTDLNMTAGQTLMFISRAQIPTGHPVGRVDVTVLTAIQTFINSTLTDTKTATDTTTTAPSDLRLIKTGSVTTAKPGDTVDYTLTYQNIGTETLTAIVIYDYLSEYMLFVSAVPLPDAGFPNASGLLRWTISGTVASGASGSVGYTVLVK